MNDHLLLDVVRHRHLLVPRLERGLVHTDLGRRCLLPPREASRDRAPLDPRHLGHDRPRRREIASAFASRSQSITKASNSAVKRELGSDHGTETCRTPCSSHSTRGACAIRIVRYCIVSR